MSRISNVVSAILLLGSAVACSAERPGSDEGRVDLVIRPQDAASSSRPARGGFTLRNLERGTLERVPLTSTYATLSVPLPAGSYVLDWRPEPAADLSEPALAERAALAESNAIRVPLVVARGRVTTVNVRASLLRSSDGEGTALASVTPGIELRIPSN
jgi:hypothetical protein